MPECFFCHQADEPERLDYAAYREVWAHRACVLGELKRDPWREPLLSIAHELGLTNGCRGRVALVCRNGHRMTPDNVMQSRPGSRRTCRRCYERYMSREHRRPSRARRERREYAERKQANWEKDACKNGHVYTPETLIVGSHGEKRCRECLKKAGRIRAAARWGGRDGQEMASGPETGG